jgi:uncharacterized protein (DUF2235 family)
MSKRIVFCADGTWDGAANNTNVYRLFKAISTIPGEQHAFYDDGVGADGAPIERLLGGIFGDGLFQKIKDGYSAIASIYEPGDEVFLFGFSRGAYTVRSLAGMITHCGLPANNPDLKMVDAVFEAYRNRSGYSLHPATIKMIGVWDTVGSLGIPAIFGGVSSRHGFLDTGLNPNIENAYHAIALDERRVEFPATLWTGTPAEGQTVEQRYFAGVHCDVGGGYPNDATGTALSTITLSWMMTKARALGLVFDLGVAEKCSVPMDKKYSLDTKHESWNPLWLFPKPRTIAPDAALANSVVVRCEVDGTYRPPNLSLVNGLPGSQYAVEVVVL